MPSYLPPNWCFQSDQARGTLRPLPDFSDSSSDMNSTSPFTANACACIWMVAFSVA